VIRAASFIASRLKSQNKITEENHSIFSKYLKDLQSSQKPKTLSLKHRGFNQIFAQKTSSLIFGFSKLEKKVWKTLNFSFAVLKKFLDFKKKSQKIKFLACENFSEILEKKVLESLKKAFLQIKFGKLARGKYARQRIKMQVLMQMFRYVTASLDTIAFCKWKVKLIEYKQAVKLLRRGVETANKAVKNGIFLNGFKTWKDFLNLFKKVKFSLFRRVLSQSETRYFFLKARWFKTLKNLQKTRELWKKLFSGENNRNFKDSFLTVLKSADLRCRCLMKTSFTRFHFNSLLEETISEIDISKVIKRRRKIVIPSGRSSRMSSKNHSRTNSLSRTLKASTPAVLKPLVLAGETRYFFTKRMFFVRWKMIPKEESFSQEEHHHVIKRKKILSPRQLNLNKLNDLEKTLENITSKSVFLAGLTRNRKNFLIRNANWIENRKDVGKLIEFLGKIANFRKNMMGLAVNLWIQEGGRFLAVRNAKFFIALRVLRNFHRRLVEKFFEEWKRFQSVSGRKTLNAFNLDSKKNVFYFEKGLKIGDRNLKLALRAFRKMEKLGLSEFFNFWMSQVKKYKNISQKVLKMIEILSKGLKIQVKKSLNFNKNKKITEKSRIKTFEFFEILKNLTWKRKVFAFKKMKGEKFTSSRQVKLKKMVKNLLFKFGSRAKFIFRPVRVIKNADEVKRNLVQKLKLRFIALYEKLKLFLSIWKLFSRSFKAKETENLMKSLKIQYSLQKVIKRIKFKSFLSIIETTKPLKSIFISKLKITLKTRMSQYFQLFKPKALKNIQNFVQTLQKLPLRSLRFSFSQLISTRRFIFLGNSLKSALRTAFTKLQIRVRSFHIFSKFKSLEAFMKIFLSSLKNSKKSRFFQWKTQDHIHKRLLGRKYILKIIYTTSLSEETAIWRWKYTIVNNQALNPQHSLVSKRLQTVSHNFQTRLCQFAFFKLLMFSRLLTIPTASSPSPNNSFSKPPFLEDYEISCDRSQPSLFSGVSSKMTKDDVLSINQSGAVEILGLCLKTCMIRRLTWAFACIECLSGKARVIENDYEDLVQQVNFLVYDKACLLEDNNSLRTHNEALIESLERTNEYCNSLSLMINGIQITKLVAHVKKMAELPLFHAFMTLKLNQDSLSSF
jgi:hypothetical protein